MIPADRARSARPGVPQHAAAAQRDRLGLQLRRSGSQHPGARAASTCCASTIVRPIKDTISVKGQTWFTKSVGINVAGASARWGLVRQRYDFTADQAKIDYTRILGANTVLEVGAGVFDSHEDGPPENDTQLARMQRSSLPGAGRACRSSPRMHNPLNVIPQGDVGQLPEQRQQRLDPERHLRQPLADHRPRHRRSNIAASLTHTRGAHTFKAGVMRERENFGQARSGTLRRRVQLPATTPPIRTTPASRSPTRLLGQVTTYTESMGRVGDNRRQTTYAWYVQDTWKVASRRDASTSGCACTSRIGRGTSATSRRSSRFERFDPRWGGNPPVLYRPITTAQGRRGVNPLTGEIVPATFIGQMVPGTGYTCGVITPTTPCQINGIVPQVNGDYVDGGVGFIDPTPVQFDPRFGMAWALNPKTVVRVAGGSFHEAHGGFYITGGPAFRFDRVVRYTDFNSYHRPARLGDAGQRERRRARSTSGRVAYRYNVGLQREIGLEHRARSSPTSAIRRATCRCDRNYNAIPAGARFLPRESRHHGDADRRPIRARCPTCSCGRSSASATSTSPSRPARSNYDSLQVQLTRRFTGGIELAGTYTWAQAATRTSSTTRSAMRRCIRTTRFPRRRREQRSNIQEHVLVISYSVDVPDFGTKMGGAAGCAGCSTTGASPASAPSPPAAIPA